MLAVLCRMPRTASPNSRVFRHDAPKSADIFASFQRFYFDTALSSSPAALPSLKSFAKNGRILFGSDFPFAPADQPEAMRGLCFRVSP
jgi:predicted TIM-barrel fold metal-dependent hydrolase